jgi:hypothetical protein
MSRERNDSVLRKTLLVRVLAVAATTLVAVGLTAGSSALAAPAAQQAGIPNFLPSAIQINKAAHTATLPLFQGSAPGFGKVWFILTDTSNLADAERLGINWAPKLANELGTPAVQHASLASGGGSSHFGRHSFVKFSGGVNFSGHRALIPGPAGFPLNPASHAGPVASKAYSPQFTFGDGVVFNGAEVANITGLHPKVLAISFARHAAVMRLTMGFYLGREVLYLSTESSDTGIAALEDATLAPNLGLSPTAGNDDPSTSAREPIIGITNGPLGVDNPQRQGLASAALGQGDPLNIIREEPECSDPADAANCSALEYSPNWDVTPVSWTQAAITAGDRVRLMSHETVEQLFEGGRLVNANPDGPVNHDPEINGLRAAGVVNNCPPIFVAPGA